MELSPQLRILVIAFVISLVAWMILIFYRGRLQREEEDRVFLGTAPERLKAEDAALMRKVGRLSIPMWILGVLTALLLLAIIGTWIYQGLLSG